jgi:predicted XRE-type DNA-binding protein
MSLSKHVSHEATTPLSQRVSHDTHVTSELTLSQVRARQEGVKQSIVALMMNVQEPAISKLEKKRVQDVPVEKLMRYINAIGGEAVLTISLPGGEQMVING